MCFHSGVYNFEIHNLYLFNVTEFFLVLQLLVSHKQREDLIKKCIHRKSGTVNDLRSQREQRGDDVKLLTTLRKQQSQVISEG